MNRSIIFATGVASFGLVPMSWGIERLTPVKEPEVKKVAAAPQTQSTAWLGVAGTPVNPALAAQLGIDHGVTLDLVAPEGSAAKSGIKKFDIITRIGDRDVRGMKDLRAVMASSKVDEKLDVEVFSKGKKQMHKVTLLARPGQAVAQRSGVAKPKKIELHSDRQKHLPSAFHHLPSTDQERIAKMMQMRSLRMEKHFAQMGLHMAEVEEMHKKMQLDLDKNIANGSSHSSSSFTMMDDKGSVHAESSGDGLFVEVKNAEGKVLYSGPYETEEDKNAVPAEVRSRIDALGINHK